MKNLAQAPHGTPVRIAAVGGEHAYRRRLMELGFLPGVEVTVVGVAPLGDPLQLEIRGCRFSIRKAEAELIAVAAHSAPAMAEPAVLARSA
ncbi:MAG TPA: FeoA family protein [Polyangiales bacterium]